MRCQERLEAYLREHKVAFQTQHHPLAYTSAEIAESEHVPGKMMAKVVIGFADDKMVMLALPASYKIDLETADNALGARKFRMASEDEFAPKFPDCEIGAMPPFGNLYNMPVYVDVSLAEDETIIFEAGTHTDTMSMKYSDFDELVEPKVVNFAAHL